MNVPKLLQPSRWLTAIAGARRAVKAAERKVPRPWLWLARVVMIAGLLFIMLRWFEHKNVYQPGRDFSGSPEELNRPFEDVFFNASDGTKLNGWFFPAVTNSPRADVAILICHGNAGNISHRLGLTEALLITGANVFVFDYRGYGQSEGRPDEAGTYRDGQAAYAWLRAKGFRGDRIVALGESLGGGIASELAVREPLGGLVLLSTFTSIPDIGAELFPWLPVRWLGRIKYDTRSKLPKLKIPVLVMHSREDDLIPFHHGERNFAAAHEPKFFCELTGGHNDASYDSPKFLEGLVRLFKAMK